MSVGAPLLGTIISAWLSVLSIPINWHKWWQVRMKSNSFYKKISKYIY